MMDAKKIGYVVVGIVVSVLIVTSLLIPVVNDGSRTVQAIEYNGSTDLIRMSYGTPDDDLKIVKEANSAVVSMYFGDSETPYYTYTLNTNGQTAWLFVSSSYSFGVTGGSNNSLFDYTSEYTGNGQQNAYGLAKDFQVDVDVSSGEITVTTGGSTYNYQDDCVTTTMFWADPDGEYVNVNFGSSYPTIYIEDPDEIYGTVMMGATYVYYNTLDSISSTGSRTSTVTATTTQLYNGLYTLDKVHVAITGSDATVRESDLSHTIVQYKVIGTPVVTGSDSIAKVLTILPLLAIVGIIIGAVSLIEIRNKD